MLLENGGENCHLKKVVAFFQMYTLENDWEEKTVSNQKIDQKKPQNQISLENERPGCPVS